MSVETKSLGQGCWYDISPAGLQLRAVDLVVEPLATVRRQFLKLIKSLI